MSAPSPVTGRCLCGQVSYRISGGISGIVVCHCSMCRKTAGGVAGVFFVANRAELEWRGEEHLASYESSPGLMRHFCARCGTAMTGANVATDDGTIVLAAGTLDDAAHVHVLAQEHTASIPAWHHEIEKAPSYEGAFPDWDRLKPRA